MFSAILVMYINRTNAIEIQFQIESRTQTRWNENQSKKCILLH